MGRIVVTDDHPLVLDALRGPLVRAGHHVLEKLAPLDFDEILGFEPQLIVIGMYRRRTAVGHEPELPPEDIGGYEALGQIESYPAIRVLPIIIVGLGLYEPEIPTKLPYDLFLTFPNEMGIYMAKADELITKVKSRRRISRFVCPVEHCGSRLVYTREPVRDLFCPKCGAGVALLDSGDALWMDAEGQHRRVPIATLRPRSTRR